MVRFEHSYSRSSLYCAAEFLFRSRISDSALAFKPRGLSFAGAVRDFLQLGFEPSLSTRKAFIPFSDREFLIKLIVFILPLGQCAL